MIRIVAIVALLPACAEAQAGTICQPDLLAGIGDSITVIFGSTLSKALGQTISVNDLAVNGYTTAQMLSTEIPRMTGQPYKYMSVLGGVNDIATSVPEATTEANLDAIYAAGVAFPLTRIIAMTILPDRDCVYCAAMVPINAHISAAATSIIRVVDTYTAFGGATPIVALYADSMHPNAAGSTIIANMIAAAMVAP